MLTRHGTREHWHIPTPFSDANGGPISLRIARPSLFGLVFAIGWTHVAGAVLTMFGMQHHMVVSLATHTACVAAAALCARLAVRRGGERAARLALGVAVLPALFLPAPPAPLLVPATAVGVAVAATLAAELGFRVAPRCVCGGPR